MENQGIYIRSCSLIVQDAQGNGIDLADLKVNFKVIKRSFQTPNSLVVRVYNLNDSTEKQIQEEFKTVILQAGYESNFGLIFSGNIKQVRFGKEKSTDKYVEISCGDGDDSYNFSTINRTLASGATQLDQISAAADTMQEGGVQVGFIDDLEQNSLPRGKVMFGMSRNYLRDSSKTADADWSIQNGQIEVVKRTNYLPGQAIVLNSDTGLVGTPQQTNAGISALALLNPLLKVNSRVKINEEDIVEAPIQDSSGTLVAEPIPEISSDGIYRIISLEHVGETFGGDWLSKIICLSVDESAPEGEQVAMS